LLHLSTNIIQRLNLHRDDEVFLSFGSKKDRVKIVENTCKDNCYFLQQELSIKFHLSGLQQPLAFYYNDLSKEVKIGPLIGILINVPAPMLEEKIASLFKIIGEKAFEAGIICCFFTPDFINFERNLISGFIYRKSRHYGQDWTMLDFPLPDIIYNQIGILNSELRPLYGKLMKQYSSKRRTVNPFLVLNDKLNNYENLRKDSSIKNHLPETMDCKNTGNIFYLLEKYKSVYLKPTASSRGFGVYKIDLIDHNEFLLQYHQTELEKKMHYLKKNGLWEMLKIMLGEQPYLVQQAIELRQYDRRPTIFRVHIFKNAQGHWDIINITIKLGTVFGVVTGNLWGGYFTATDDLLRKMFSDAEAQTILHEMKGITVKIARAIEIIHNREFGEMGFDFAVDVNNKIWMIEVNPKPNFLAAGMDKKKIEENLALHLLGCCRHLLHLKACRSMIGFPDITGQFQF